MNTKSLLRDSIIIHVSAHSVQACVTLLLWVHFTVWGAERKLLTFTLCIDLLHLPLACPSTRRTWGVAPRGLGFRRGRGLTVASGGPLDPVEGRGVTARAGGPLIPRGGRGGSCPRCYHHIELTSTYYIQVWIQLYYIRIIEYVLYQ